MPGIIHVILLKTLHFILSQILQMRWPGIFFSSCVQTRSLSYKILSIVFSSSNNALQFNIQIYCICNIFNLCHNVLICNHQDRISWLLCSYGVHECVMALLRKWRARRLSTFPAGTLVTNQTNARSVGPVWMYVVHR